MRPTLVSSYHYDDWDRKCYSVRLADFKLRCFFLWEVSTQHPRIPFWVYALYRLEVAAYFFVCWITYTIVGEKNLGPRFFVFLPFWTFTAATCYVCCAFFNAVMDFVKSRRYDTFEDEFRYQIQWFFFNITATPSVTVTILYWQYLFYFSSEKVPILLYVSIHILPTIVCLIDILITLIVVRFVHVIYPVLCLIIYLIFTFLYLSFGGTGLFENSIIRILDFESYAYGTRGLLSVVGVTLITLPLQACFKGLYALRIRCMDN
ncbi:protein rolling stone-like [Diadema setosum]|uniref:protein rolling stone-like n=1 Tax=Diadema setosum TaxID=31175 RepID=UPI003B3B56EB